MREKSSSGRHFASPSDVFGCRAMSEFGKRIAVTCESSLRPVPETHECLFAALCASSNENVIDV
jgi:hypothetical protein